MKSMKDWEKSEVENFDEFFLPGDIVAKDVIEHYRNITLPITDNSYILQVGGAIDLVDGKSTYMTFENTTEGWVYKGDCHKGETKSPFEKWLNTFIEEKGIDTSEQFKSTKDGISMPFSYDDVLDSIKFAPRKYQEEIKNELVKIDFENKDVKKYLRHLSQALLPSVKRVEEMESIFGESINLEKEPLKKEDLYNGTIPKEDLYNYSMRELRTIKEEIEKDIKDIKEDPIWKRANNIEEKEATNELIKDMEELDGKEQDLLFILEDIKEIIQEKELEGEEEEEDEL